MKKALKKIEILEQKLGVKVKIDPALDKLSNVTPDKMKDSAIVLANSKLSL